MRRYALVAGGSVVGMAVVATIATWCMKPSVADAHCQMPCGIYDDKARVAELYEDTMTIEKAMNEINKLAAAHDAESLNQATRWVTTKEAHASHISELVSEYFLMQRVKPVAKGKDGYGTYLETLADHHAVLIAAMKAKQNVNPVFAAHLHKAVDELAKHYD